LELSLTVRRAFKPMPQAPHGLISGDETPVNAFRFDGRSSPILKDFVDWTKS
jgi:hypothetical protein